MLSARVAQVEAEVAALRHGLPPPVSDSGATFLDYAKHAYLKAHEHKKSYADDCSQVAIIGEIIGDVRLSAFGKREVVKIERALLSKEPPRSTTTVNRYMALLRHIFNHAIGERVIHENPVKCYVPYVEEPKRRALSAGEIRDVLCAAAAIQEHPASKAQAHIYDIIAIALNTGMRLSEILNLKWDHVRGGVIALPYNMTKSRRRRVGEKARFKVIPINAEVRAILDSAPRRSEYVLDLGRVRGHDAIRRTVKQIRALSGVKEFSMHYLRHTVSTHLAAQVNIAAAKELLGHSNIQTTLKYTHPGLDEKTTGVSNLGNRFREIADN